MSIETPDHESFGDAVDPNKKVKTKQNMRYMVMAGAVGAVVVAIIFGIAFSETPAQKAAKAAANGQKEDPKTAEHVRATGAVATFGQQTPEYQLAQSEDQLREIQTKYQEQNGQLANLSAENADLKSKLQQQTSSPMDAISQLPRQMLDVRQQSAQMLAANAPQAQGMSVTQDDQQAAPPRPKRTLLLVTQQRAADRPQAGQAEASGVSVENGTGAATVKTATGSQVAADGMTVYDSREFVPPNSYVQAKMLVGADLQTGVSGQADPKPVLLRIQSDAVGVGMNGKYQHTNLKGCLVNGAAWGELSSEKIYIKLQKITCQVDANHYMTANVEGFVVSKGKAGVRGNVVSREGNLTKNAMIAGLFQGLGQAMNRNNQASLSSLGTSGGGTVLGTQSLSGEQIAQSTVGGGIENAATTLSQYLIKRAEQYQPVIEMQTGVTVDLVFQSGFRIPLVAQAKN